MKNPMATIISNPIPTSRVGNAMAINIANILDQKIINIEVLRGCFQAFNIYKLLMIHHNPINYIFLRVNIFLLSFRKFGSSSLGVAEPVVWSSGRAVDKDASTGMARMFNMRTEVD